ncbi:MAG: cytochrome b/b6 domain-containing protein [Polyangiaceae bacterium]|jgi:cytochrome b|nr:cytochrome b/b6 domain-containing protein [Polyangiaceae bacterium]MBK8938029.1 cytochrome b/b6 domain-containing protein [Polyangiaceae bacterium]
MNGNRTLLVWDLPTRLFHWLLAASVLGAFAIGLGVDDESRVFAVHMLLGAVAAFMVLLRVVWGLFGSRYARFGSFAFGPSAVLGYFRGLFTRSDARWIGHNPGSSLAIFAMIVLTLGVALTGALMGTAGEVFEEVHEILAYSLIGVAVGHVAGVALHTLRHRENLTGSMVHGLKVGDPKQGIRSAHPGVALVFLGLTTAWAVALTRGYDPTTGSVRLPLVGTTLTLGEGAEGERGQDGEEGDDD